MKKIILATIGLAMFATPLAAGTPHSSGVSQHERHLYGLDRNASAIQVPVRSPARFFVSPVGSQSFGLTLGSNPAGSNPAGSYSARPHGGIGVPYSTPPQGWPLNR
jgi:hypothetical protein